MRYLGVFVVRSRSFKCAYDNAKRSFYSAVNGILVKVLNLASEDVILRLIVSKCMPILLYGHEACPVNKTDLRSLNCRPGFHKAVQNRKHRNCSGMSGLLWF